MKIRNQVWIETETHLVILLREPFWSAYKRYGWEYGVEGFGVSKEAIEKAEELGKKIRVNLLKYGSYEITAKRAQKYANNVFIPRDNKPLIVIPRTEFKKISSEERKKEYEEKEHERAITFAKAEFNLG